ncbi:MAG: hypothetical protein JWR50_2532 [Mucilaginibacter sp.]|nr:hypothetical protein [Mucilaginibacter sp.]
MSKINQYKKIIAGSTAFVMLFFGAASFAQNKPAIPNTEKTTFQTGGTWKPTTDLRADVAIVYGDGGKPGQFEQRVKSFRDHGYQLAFMTGMAWGGYQDYFMGKWDGKQHFDEGQKMMNGDTV